MLVSSHQLDSINRGFSCSQDKLDAQLDMRFDQTDDTKSVLDIINNK